MILREISRCNILMIELYLISIGILKEIHTETKSLILTIIVRVMIKGEVVRT